MVKYIKGKDGKMAGSIGSGKTAVPISSDLPRNARGDGTSNCPNCGARYHTTYGENHPNCPANNYTNQLEAMNTALHTRETAGPTTDVPASSINLGDGTYNCQNCGARHTGTHTCRQP